MTDMTPDEQTELAELLADLHERGYRDIDAHDKLRPGVRIRHRGQQYAEALAAGTGNVVAVTEKPNSSWSLTYGMPDVELVVLFDHEPSDDRLAMLAQYHVEVIEGAP